jgi:hypothetical protein
VIINCHYGICVKSEKPILNDKKVTARTQFVTDAQTSLTVIINCH